MQRICSFSPSGRLGGGGEALLCHLVPLVSSAGLALVIGCLETSTIRCTDGKALNDELTECTRCLADHTRQDLPDGGFRCVPGTGDGGIDAPADAPSGDASADVTDASACPTACADPTPVCRVSDGVCVECVAGDDCDHPEADLCRETDGICVECLSDDRCFPGAPRCRESDGTCVECISGDDCDGATPLCRESDSTCVACLAGTDCTDPTAAQCDTATGTCVPCTSDAACAHLESTPVCAETVGQCVQCTPDTEHTTCPAPEHRACHPGEFTCTGAERGSLGFCQACVSDSECGTFDGTFRCVAMNFAGEPHGAYCLLDLESYRMAIDDENALCPNQMVVDRGATSVLGVEATYCFVDQGLTTCEATLDYRSACPGGDADCGATGVDDGKCIGGECSYECTGERECGSTSTCTGGATRYCTSS